MRGERRLNRDRRIYDAGPPGDCEERRKLPERRLPEVTHVDFSEHIEIVSVDKSFDADLPPPP